MAVALSPIFNGWQGFYPVGVPLVAGKIFTYAAGTTTPLATYTTASGGIANTNPIILDSGGRPPQEIWLTVGVAYKFVLQDALGNTLGTYDDIYGIEVAGTADTLRADLASSVAGKGSKLVAFIQRLAGAVARWVEDKLSESISVKDFGAVGDGTTNDTSAIVAANTAAIAAGQKLYFPGGTYKFVPTAITAITDWYGDGPDLSQIKVDCTSYSGVVFRMPGSTETRDLRIYEDGFSDLGTGIQLSATNTDEFTGHQRLTRVLVQGFSKNIDLNNVFFVTFEQVRSEYGTEGLWCTPADNPGDNGYVTTLAFNSCEFGFNVRNVYFSPALQSRVVVFNGGSIEGATGAAEQSYFTKLVALEFNGTYCEGASSIPAMRLVGVTATIDAIYLNGTGGIALGSSTELSITQSASITSTDVLTGGDGTQKVRIDGCSFPSVGNAAPTSFAQFNAYRSSYNGVTYAAFHGNHAVGFIDDTYSASMTPNLRFGNFVRYTVNNATAFTVNAPLNGIAGTELSITFKKTVGAANVITWNAVFKIPAITLPAAGFNRTYTFLFDGTNWLFQGQTQADVPN